LKDPYRGSDAIEGESVAAAPDDNAFTLAQFQSLRAEIILLIQLQAQMIGINVVALGAIVSVAVQGDNGSVALVYPLLSLIIGISWLSHAHSITRTSGFLAHIEKRHMQKEDRWENYLRSLSPGRFNRVSFWGVRAVFPVGSMLALLAGLLIGIEGPLAWIAFCISAVITLATLVMFAFLNEPSHEIAPAEAWE
jgi:hypothetical protein